MLSEKTFELINDISSPVAMIMCASEIDKVHTEISLKDQQLALGYIISYLRSRKLEEGRVW